MIVKMISIMRFAFFLCFGQVFFAMTLAHAGDSCQVKDISVSKVRDGVRAGYGLEKWLNRSGADVVVIGRQGDAGKQFDIHFTHAAFAKKDELSGHWAVYHQLNICPRNQSELFQDGLAPFFMSDPISYKAAVVVPKPEIQAKIKAILNQPEKLKKMHNEHYSVVAYPFSTLRQNCDGWVLEIFAQAVSGQESMTRKEAQQWLFNQSYQPTLIKVGSFKQMGASLLASNISVKDHPQELTRKNEIWFNTADSILKFMTSYASPSQNCEENILGKGVCIVDTWVE